MQFGAIPLIVAAALAQQPDPAGWDFAAAEKAIVRLPPSAFSALPAPIVQELERRRCRVPQPADAREPRNVIQGEFAHPGQTDWAVLCSVQGVSRILVFWNGTPSDPARLAPAKDGDYLQVVAPNRIGFSRGISAVGKDDILRRHQAYGGPTPPPIRHQGIDDAFIEKASVTWYLHRGQWLRLTGAD